MLGCDHRSQIDNLAMLSVGHKRFRSNFVRRGGIRWRIFHWADCGNGLRKKFAPWGRDVLSMSSNIFSSTKHLKEGLINNVRRY